MRLRLLLAAALVLGCSSTNAPTPTPASMNDLIANLVLRGVTVHRLVSGDPGCPSSGLHSNAVYLEVALRAQSALHPVYLMRWRRPADFEAAAVPFDDCVNEYRAMNPDAVVGTLEVAPWRAYGPFWNEMLQETLGGALRDTVGG